MDKLPQLLQQVTAGAIKHMQTSLSHVWRRFLYSNYAFFPEGLARHKSHEDWQPDLQAAQWPHPSPPASYHGEYTSDDAFSTIVHWLYYRTQQQPSHVRSPLRPRGH